MSRWTLRAGKTDGVGGGLFQDEKEREVFSPRFLMDVGPAAEKAIGYIRSQGRHWFSGDVVGGVIRGTIDRRSPPAAGDSHSVGTIVQRYCMYLSMEGQIDHSRMLL